MKDHAAKKPRREYLSWREEQRSVVQLCGACFDLLTVSDVTLERTSMENGTMARR